LDEINSAVVKRERKREQGWEGKRMERGKRKGMGRRKGGGKEEEGTERKGDREWGTRRENVGV
jgi:hypothetical protein